MTCILKCLHSSKSELAFSPYGFQTWKNATQAFRKHESSTAHSDNVRAWWNYSKRVSCSGVEDSGWSWTTVCSKELVQKYFHYNFWQSKGYLTLQFLAKQGSKVVTKKNNWTSHDIQNETIEITAHSVWRSIVHDVKANKWFSLIVDEATDSSFTEQVSICLRHVDIKTRVLVSEIWKGRSRSVSKILERSELESNILLPTPQPWSKLWTFMKIWSIFIKQETLRQRPPQNSLKFHFAALGLDLNDCRGQVYDGAYNMSHPRRMVACLEFKHEKHLNIPKQFYSLLLSFFELGCGRLFNGNTDDGKRVG